MTHMTETDQIPCAALINWIKAELQSLAVQEDSSRSVGNVGLVARNRYDEYTDLATGELLYKRNSKTAQDMYARDPASREQSKAEITMLHTRLSAKREILATLCHDFRLDIKVL